MFVYGGKPKGTLWLWHTTDTRMNASFRFATDVTIETITDLNASILTRDLNHSGKEMLLENEPTPSDQSELRIQHG